MSDRERSVNDECATQLKEHGYGVRLGPSFSNNTQGHNLYFYFKSVCPLLSRARRNGARERARARATPLYPRLPPPQDEQIGEALGVARGRKPDASSVHIVTMATEYLQRPA